ncbi:MAG TPA: glycosyltransferase family 4 protein [Bacteroidia bacterium]|nr:glycosyltransferase family 4 protein [Bacteroidia bacterium]
MKARKRIALLMVGVSSTGCGGAERFFADFFREYRASAKSANELFFFTDPGTLQTLKTLRKLDEVPGVVKLSNVSNRFKRMLENWNILRKVIAHRINIIHVTNYGRNYFDRLSFLSRLPGFIRPRIIVNIVDCEIPYALGDKNSPKHEGYTARYMPLFNSIKPDGIFTWYKLFCEFAQQEKLLKTGAALDYARTRFTDTKGFSPAAVKQKHIVFAARLTGQKQPLMFVEAIHWLKQNHPELLRGWQCFMYGVGPLAEETAAMIRSKGLEDVLNLLPNTDLRPVYAASTCFVSTQDYENFPSLSMNEAMAAGNVIVARNVGQTNVFVKDGKNGFLAKEDNAQGVGEALARFLQEPERHGAMMNESLRLAREVHTPGNFIEQIDAFWERV